MKKITALEEELGQVRARFDLQEKLTNKMRKDYTRDNQNLRNALLLCGDPIDRSHGERVKLAVDVFNFNDLAGLPPELADFFNEKM